MGRIGVAVVMAAALILPVLTACSSEPPPPVAVRTSTPTPSPKPVVPDIPQSRADLGSLNVAPAVAPVRLVLERLSITMPVMPEGLDPKGAMALPANAADAGWYQYSPGLHEAQGATVIAAHIDSWHDGIGPLSRLKNAVNGDLISVAGSDGSTVAYTVTEVREVGKIDAPMAEVFDRSGAPRLTLVTCGGVFNSATGHYLDNIIVTATPVVAPPDK
ncbi:class F sortase [Lacisediminihabitans sp.]|uniref:class F sortase n=1 Tax=Lacisediminihabitans sp. TaxID=2787631 RepID=UPI00374DC021